MGLLQGIAEFLPISSSGHLVLGQHLLGIDVPRMPNGDADISFEVFVHFGTVLSIVTVYRERITTILKDLWRAIRQPSLIRQAWAGGPIERAPEEPFSQEVGDETGGALGVIPSTRLSLYVLLSMIPTGIVYVLFADFFEDAFSDPRFVCGMLLVTGTVLLLTRLRPNPGGHLTPLKTALVGLAQSAALIPGISRSGSTICTAIYMNVDRKEAADFSFLMSLPVIVGATGLKALDLFETGLTVGLVPLVVGTLVAFASGIWAIKVVIAFVQRGSLAWFAAYCYVAGVLGLIFI
ncbi:undecaprenyl-diphosphate phosphatase [Rubrivirga sp.]|uniref:undecaprenyl-diphosphate phosphatase n=1 Tax=Rubrivirga sp. TaxID=1885344 RepID=UPI003C75411D